MLIVLGAVAVIALAVLLLFGGGGGGGGNQPPGAIFVPRTELPNPRTSASASGVPAEGTYTPGNVAKDPFMPPGGFGLPSSSGLPTPGPGASPQPTGGTPGHSKVVLLDIFMENGVRFASVQVDGQTHNVKEGDTFANVYRVITITDQCATFVQGDERFTLCIGQQVFK
ncbi:MAG: hypothetical protein ACYDCC_04065 [Actinomycetota bacterium]